MRGTRGRVNSMSPAHSRGVAQASSTRRLEPSVLCVCPQFPPEPAPSLHMCIHVRVQVCVWAAAGKVCILPPPSVCLAL